MILIGSDIIAGLKAHTFTFDKKVNATSAYTASTPTCPMLTIDELPSNDGIFIDGMPCVVRNILTLEAYVQDSYIQKVLTSKHDAAIRLIMEADAFLNQQFGLTMIGPIKAAPYTDTTIFRAVANYFAYIDTRTNTICRSIKK